ncbi:MAG: hypothetical protein ACYDCK_06115 [Thermoplasmatota archaeon]
MANERGWTPYGLEAIRQAYLRRRRVIAAVVVLALALAWFVFLTSGTSRTTGIFANGKEGTIELDVPAAQKDKPVTVAISPGKTAEVLSDNTPAPSTTTRNGAAAPATATPVNWAAYAVQYGPYIALGTLLWAIWRRKPTEEVNFGVYKGAMPLEIITASHAHLVLTTKPARASLFGKRRADFVASLETSADETTRRSDNHKRQ